MRRDTRASAARIVLVPFSAVVYGSLAGLLSIDAHTLPSESQRTMSRAPSARALAIGR
jgi:hypothetical protein